MLFDLFKMPNKLLLDANLTFTTHYRISGMAGVPAWQGVPQPQLPAGQMPQLHQPASMLGAYPVQQFQVNFNLT